MINIDKLVFIGAFARGAFNCKYIFICLRRIYFQILNFLFIRYFLSLFLSKEKGKKVTKESKKKRVQTYQENPRVTHSVRSDFVMSEMLFVRSFLQKYSQNARIFGMFYLFFRLFSSLGSCGSNAADTVVIKLSACRQIILQLKVTLFSSKSLRRFRSFFGAKRRKKR